MNNKEINLLREKVDSLDNKIINLLDERLKLSLNIALEKQKNNLNIYDKNREINIIDRLKKLKKNYLSNNAIEKIYKEILNNSVTEMEKYK